MWEIQHRVSDKAANKINSGKCYLTPSLLAHKAHRIKNDNFFWLLAVVVHPHKNKKKEKDYSKRERCYFCSKYLKSRMTKHLTHSHAAEPLVSEAMQANDQRDREKLLQRIQNLGNFVHNMNVRCVDKHLFNTYWSTRSKFVDIPITSWHRVVSITSNNANNIMTLVFFCTHSKSWWRLYLKVNDHDTFYHPSHQSVRYSQPIIIDN